MEKLHILGTGNAMVTECYNTCFAIENDGKYFVTDTGGGNGILARLKQAKIGIHEIEHLFISHNHIDHILGVIWIIRAYGAYVSKNINHVNLKIYAHEGVIEIIELMIKKLLNQKQAQSLEGKLELITIDHGDEINVYNWSIRFFDILSTKDKQFGYVMKLASKKNLVFLGDEPYRNEFESFCINTDYLLHEAFCLYEERDQFKPYDKHHVTVKDACENAAKLNVKNLILYHTEDSHYANRKDLYLNEGKTFYKGNLYVPYDLDVIEL